MRARFDAGEVDSLHETLINAAGPATEREVEQVIKKGALNIKRDAATRIRGLTHAPAYPRAISYDLHRNPVGLYAEIGPDKDRRQGALGNVLEYGTVNNPPHPHMRPAAEEELPRFARAIEDLAVRNMGPAT